MTRSIRAPNTRRTLARSVCVVSFQDAPPDAVASHRRLPEASGEASGKASAELLTQAAVQKRY